MAQVYATEEHTDYHLIEESPQEYEILTDFELVEKFSVDDDIEATIQYNAYIKNELEKNFPLRYVIAHSVAMILLNVSLIILEIVAIKKNAALSDLGLAIWVGIYNLFTVFLVLLTSKFNLYYSKILVNN
jgi:hypothetical protein